MILDEMQLAFIGGLREYKKEKKRHGRLWVAGRDAGDLTY